MNKASKSHRKRGKISFALRNVQRFFPNVIKVSDADDDLEIEVTQKDVRQSVKKDHHGCALAVAMHHEKKCTGAIVSASVAFVIKGDKAIRYSIPERARKEIVSFDRGASFEPGEYTLKAPKSSYRLGHITGGNGPSSGKRRILRRTLGIRERLGSKTKRLK